MRDDGVEPRSSRGRRRAGLEHLVPEVVLTSDQGQITLRQLEVLRAVSQERSQNKAAARLGISAPVLNRQLKQLERKAQLRLVRTSKRGSELTLEGRELLRALDMICRRISRESDLSVGCTPVTQPLVERICTKLALRGERSAILVSDDDTSFRLASAGLLDIAFFDDPVYAFEYPGEGKVHEVAKDFLMHCDRGNNAYARLSSGPQRIGFETLRSRNRNVEIKLYAVSPEELVRSPYSFFVSKILLNNRRLELPKDAKVERLPYTLYSIETSEHPNAQLFFDCMTPRQYYPIG